MAGCTMMTTATRRLLFSDTSSSRYFDNEMFHNLFTVGYNLHNPLASKLSKELISS